MVALPRQVSSSLGQVGGVILIVYDIGVKLQEQSYSGQSLQPQDWGLDEVWSRTSVGDSGEGEFLTASSGAARDSVVESFQQHDLKSASHINEHIGHSHQQW